jgi:methyl-accepting chemotaxis protein
LQQAPAFLPSALLAFRQSSARSHPIFQRAQLREIPVMFAKFSIRAKIAAVIALLLVAMTGMGLLAVWNMRSLNASTAVITRNWLPSVRVLGDLRAGVITYRNVIREHMLVETAEEKDAAEKILATVIESNLKIRRAMRR